MGVDYSAVIMVGLLRKDFKDTEQLAAWIDQDELECCAPSYDGGDSPYAAIGFALQTTSSFSPRELVWDQEKVHVLKGEFLRITGMEAKIWLSPKGW